MAGQIGGPSFNLKLHLLKEGHTFSFFQVIRLLRLLNREAAQSEAQRPIEDEHIRIRPDLSLAFPASDIARVEELPGEASSFLVTATFLGLYGTSSPLPTFYTEDLLDEKAEDKSITRDFIDIIHHRLFLLFFQCWTKYRQFLQVVEEDNHHYLDRLFCLLGLGEKKLREGIPEPYGLIRYAGLFTQFPRSAAGLKTLLCDALGGIPVEIVPCRTRRIMIPHDQRMLLGVSGVSLGEDSFVGEEIEDRMGAFRIRVGPLNQDQFHALLPGNDSYDKLSFLTRFYLTEPLEYDLELIASGAEVRTVCLGASRCSRLGLDTWIFSGDYCGEARAVFHPESG